MSLLHKAHMEMDMNTDWAERRRAKERISQQHELARETSERARAAAEQARAVAEAGRRAAANDLRGTVAMMTALLDRMQAVEEMRRAARNGGAR